MKEYFQRTEKKNKCSTSSQKNEKQIVTNYRLASLLLVCSKILERRIYNVVNKFMKDNLVFVQGDLCINQLLSITHNSYCSFDEEFEIRTILLDISKAFGKVRHERFI